MRRLALLGLAVLAIVAGAWWVAKSGERTGLEHGAPGEPGTIEGAAPDAVELRAPASPPTLVRSDPGAPRESVAEDAPTGLVHGRLVTADGGRLAGVRLVLLATPGDAVAETLRTKDDGAFVSTRRFPRGPLRAFVTEADTGQRLARHEAEFDPTVAREWLVPVVLGEPEAPEFRVWLADDEDDAMLRGRVVDLAGRGVRDAQVRLLPLDGGELCFAAPDDEGRFEMRSLASGAYRLRVHGRFVASVPLDVALLGELVDVGEIELPARLDGGAIRGSLVLGGHEEGLYFLCLRDLAGGHEIAVPSEWKLFQDDEDDRIPFEIPGVPPGDYELSVVAFEGLAFEPAVMRVSPPADELEFRAADLSARRYRVRVVDAGSGDELDDYTCLLRIHGQIVGGRGSPADDFEFSTPAWDPWTVFSAEHRPERVELARARRVSCEDEYECYEATVELHPGFGQALVFKDVESDHFLLPGIDEPFLSPGLAGVRVHVDGALAATSDADGLALLDLPRAPGRIELEHPGWRVVGEETEDGVRFVYLASP